jgi:hypothetical protein
LRATRPDDVTVPPGESKTDRATRIAVDARKLGWRLYAMVRALVDRNAAADARAARWGNAVERIVWIAIGVVVASGVAWFLFWLSGWHRG